VDQLPVAVDQVEAGNWPTPTVQEAGKIGNQANHGQLALSNHPALRGEVTREKFEKGKHGLAAQANPSTDGSRLESWATPRNCGGPDYAKAGRESSPIKSMSLPTQVMAWPTPAASTGNGGAHGLGGGSGANQTLKRFNVPEMGTGKLNPRWVETLMGLPVGWTMPSCACPATIAPTSFDCSATELSPPQQNERSLP